MPYVPPHLRPGYVPSAPKVVDYTGKVHWPTNLDTHRADNVVQPTKIAGPTTLTGQTIAAAAPATADSLGLAPRKSIMKLVRPITPNTNPVARPTMSVRNLPAKFKNTVRLHLRRRSRGMKKGEAKKQTRRIKKARMLAKRR